MLKFEGLILTVGGVGLSICLTGMAWCYGEYKKIEGRQEASKDITEGLTKLRIDLIEERLKVKEAAE